MVERQEVEGPVHVRDGYFLVFPVRFPRGSIIVCGGFLCILYYGPGHGPRVEWMGRDREKK